MAQILLLYQNSPPMIPFHKMYKVGSQESAMPRFCGGQERLYGANSGINRGGMDVVEDQISTFISIVV